MSTGSGLSAFLDNVFAQILRQIVCITEKKLSCKYLLTPRDTEKEKASFPVDVNASNFGRVLKKVPKLLFWGHDWASDEHSELEQILREI